MDPLRIEATVPHATVPVSASRVRVGVYRILYEVFDDRLVVHVVRVGRRRKVYRPR